MADKTRPKIRQLLHRSDRQSGVFLYWNDTILRLPVLDDCHVRQKHPVSLPTPDHRVNPVGQKTSCDIAIA
jgi:hypothetical protein